MEETIAFITDLHLDDEVSAMSNAHPRENFLMVVDDIRQRKIKTVFLGGDLGDPSSLPWLFEKLEGFEVFVILGNHDHYAEVKKFWKGGGQDDAMYYSFQRNDHHVICLDSSSAIVSHKQVEWLKNELQEEKDIMMLIHHPIIPVGSIVDVKYPMQKRDELLQLIDASGKTVNIFCGHCHYYDEKHHDNIQQVTVPAVCFQVGGTEQLEIDTASFGYCLLQIKGQNVNTEIVRFNTD